jgi:hypothetical protein
MADQGNAGKHRLTQNPPTKETRTAAAESSHHASPHHAGQPEPFMRSCRYPERLLNVVGVFGESGSLKLVAG